MNKIQIIQTEKINNPEILTNIIYNNFKYLKDVIELHHTPKEIEQSIKANGSFNYLVYYMGNNSELIGYLIGNFKNLSDGRYVYYISYLYIIKKFRKSGIGTKLMNLLIEECKNDEVKFIILTYDTCDDKIIKFYKKYGFVKDLILGKNNTQYNIFCLYL